VGGGEQRRGRDEKKSAAAAGAWRNRGCSEGLEEGKNQEKNRWAIRLRNKTGVTKINRRNAPEVKNRTCLFFLSSRDFK
jgi:hypothetical protein